MPRGAWKVNDLRPRVGDERGDSGLLLHPRWSVLLSFVGDVRPRIDFALDWWGRRGARDCPLVELESGRSYRWDWMRGLHSIVLVRPGVDAREAVSASYSLCAAGRDREGPEYTGLVDVDLNVFAWVTYLHPMRVLRETSWRPMRCA